MASIETRTRGGKLTPAYKVHTVVWREGPKRPRATMDNETDAAIMLALVNAAGDTWPSADVLRARGLGYVLDEPDPANAGPAVPTLDEYAVPYFDRIKKLGRINGATPERYEQRYRAHVLPTLGHLPLTVTDLSPQVLIEWQYNLGQPKGKRPGLAPKTILNIRGEVLSPILKDAMKVGPSGEPPILQWNPLANVDAPKKRPVRVPIIDGPDESRWLLRAAYDRVREGRNPFARRSAADIAVVQLGTGLRWSELAPITVGQVDRVRREIDIDRTVERRFVDAETGERRSYWVLRDHGKTDAATRTVTYPPELDHLMTLLCEGRPDAAYICPGPTGADFWRYEAWYPHWRAIKTELLKFGYRRAKLTPHGLRHSALSALVAFGVDLATLRHMAGHASITTTINTYGKPTAAGLESARVALSSLTGSLATTRIREAQAA